MIITDFTDAAFIRYVMDSPSGVKLMSYIMLWPQSTRAQHVLAVLWLRNCPKTKADKWLQPLGCTKQFDMMPGSSTWPE